MQDTHGNRHPDRLSTRRTPSQQWAALIMVLVGTGILTCFVGLIVAMPLVGQGILRAYRDLVSAE